MKYIDTTFAEAGINMFSAELNEREAFRAMFSFASPLAALDAGEVANLEKAIANAEAFAAEVVTKLREGAQPMAEVA
jgi:chromosome partitioning protein